MIMQGQSEMINKRIQTILDKIKNAALQNKRENQVRLIAVSKTKSVQEIKAAYDCGLRHFGENYVDEIQAKQPKLPLDIKWHFIGHLQSNKIKKVVVPNLQYLETVDRSSLAQKLQKHLQKIDKEKKLKVLIQVKTSEQQSKHGASTQQIFPLLQFIQEKCPNLIFKGLMTIGKQGDFQAFLQLVELKNKIIQKHKILQQEFELSMGMSGDFQVAIEHGSTSVRVGSSIFGPRSYPKKQQKVEQA